MTESVRNRIENIEICDENYPVVRRIINDRYNSREKIVQALYTKLEHLPKASDNTKSLRKTYDDIESILRALELQREPINNVLVMNQVAQKIPHNVLFQLSTDKVPDLPMIRDRVDTYITVQEKLTAGNDETPDIPAPAIASPPLQASFLAASLKSNAPANKKDTTTNKSKGNNNTSTTLKPPSCAFCKATHYSDQCTKFATAKERKAAMPNMFCILCLRTNHEKPRCRTRSHKPCFYCKRVKAHHSAFCPQTFGYFSEKWTEADTQKAQATTVALVKNEKGTYLTAMGTVVNPLTGESMTARIMLDCGAPGTYATNATAAALNLVGTNKRVQPIGRFASDDIGYLESEQVHFRIRANDYEIDVFADSTPIISKHVTPFDVNHFKVTNPKYEHLDFADPGDTNQVDILLGNDYLFHFLLPESTRQIEPGVFLVKTIFGWMVTGRIQRYVNKPLASLIAANTTSNTLKVMWELESIGIRDPNQAKAETEDNAIQQFTTNLKYENGRYNVTLPWKQYPPNLPNNYALARGRLFSLIKKHSVNPELLHACKAIFAQQIKEGIIEIVNREPDSRLHYLPFHFVLTPEKSTPIRAVYDANARASKNANSLNDSLLKGLNLIPQIPAIIIRFRLNPIAMIADIMHAFHALDIQQHERDYLRFLWTTNFAEYPREQTLITFRFARVPFGCISSSFLLAAMLIFHLRSSNDTILKLIERNLYVNDFVISATSCEEALAIVTDSRKIFQVASMNLHKWNTNHEKLRSQIPADLIESKKITRVLGLTWDTVHDTIHIVVPKPFDYDQPLTKRRILRSFAQLYDPLSWSAPVMITAKILLQDLHKNNYNWNDPMPDEYLQQWKNIFENLVGLQCIAVPRYMPGRSANKSWLLHVFADASAKAYATVVYLRYTHPETQRIDTQIVMAKARVAPIEKMTIPRLELLAVLIGIRALQFVRSSLYQHPGIKATIWSDSKCVLDWVKSKHKLPIFVQNRVDEIRRAELTEFRHVPGQDNLADLPSRGISTEDLIKNDLWWHGPSWRQKYSNEWPPVYVESDDFHVIEPEIETKLIMSVSTPIKPPPLLEIDEKQYTRFPHLMRVTAYCIQFLRRFKKSREKAFFQQNRSSLELARILWLRYVQRLNY